MRLIIDSISIRFSIKPPLSYSQPPYPAVKPSTAVSGDIDVLHPTAIVQTPWEGRAIATHKFHLFEFSAYMELQREETVSSNWSINVIQQNDCAVQITWIGCQELEWQVSNNDEKTNYNSGSSLFIASHLNSCYSTCQQCIACTIDFSISATIIFAF